MNNEANNKEAHQSAGSLEEVLALLKKSNEEVVTSIGEDVVLILDTSDCERNAFANYVLDNGNVLWDPTEFRKISSCNRRLQGDGTDGTFYYVSYGFTESLQEITSNYFVKKVVESAKSIKLLLVVDYSNISDRRDFLIVVERLSQFIKDMGKFNNSIALLVTDSNEKEKTKSDELFVENIVRNIKTVQQHFENTGSNQEMFIDTLLTQINGEFTKIAIFRRPHEVDHSLAEPKQKLIKLAKGSLQFVQVNDLSFDYTLSTKNQKIVRDWRREIEQNIDKKLIDFSENIEKHYYIMATKSQDVDMLGTMFKSVNRISSKISGNVDPEQFLKVILNCFHDLPFFNESISNIFNLIYDLKLLHILNGTTPCTGYSCFMEHVGGIKEYLYDSERWYSFLSDLNRRLSEYDVQRNVSHFNITAFKYPGNENRKLKFIQTNASLLLEQLPVWNEVRAQGDIGNIYINSVKLKALNDILNTSLNYKVKISCSSVDGLTLTGNFLRLSQVKDAKTNACPESNITSMRLFSLRKIFIDSEFDAAGDGRQLTIIAPTWEVVGNRKIIFDGKAGVGSVEQDQEQSGTLGVFGSPKGIFFGIGTRFINAQGLFVRSDGVGSGQEKGISATAGSKLVLVSNSDSGNGDLGGFQKKITWEKSIKNKVIVHNKNLEPSEPINMHNEDAPARKEEKGLLEGNSPTVETTRGINLTINHLLENASKLENSVIFKENIPYPSNSTFENGTGVISDFRNAMMDSLDYDPRKEFSMKFLNDLDNDERVARLTDTLGLIEEFKGLEHRFRNMPNHKSILPHYHSLLERIAIYAKNPNENERSEEYRKVLSYLYTTALSKVSLINSQSESDLVIDLASYLDSMGSSILKLKENIFETASEELYTIYKDKINKNIKDAEDCIVSNLLPETEITVSDINDEIKSLIQETIQLQNQSLNHIESLRIKKEKLKNYLLLNKLISAIKLVGCVLSLVSPVGSLVHKVITVGADLFKTYEKKKIKEMFPEISNNVYKGLKAIPQYIEDKMDDLSGRLDSLYDMLKESPKPYKVSELEEIEKKIFEKRDLINKERSKGVAMDPVYINSLMKGLKKDINIQRKRFERMISIGKKEYKTPLETIGHIETVLEMSTDLYENINKDENKIDEISKQITEEKTKILALEQSEQMIYHIIMPLYENIRKFVTNLDKDLKDQTGVILEFKKWKVQIALKDLTFQLKKWTGWFHGEDILSYINKLEDSILIVISMYDLIDRYREETELYAFVSHMSSTSMTSITISDRQLKNSVNDLEFIIKSNIVKSQYEKAMSALKQNVFPLARSYLVVLPSALDTGDLITNAVAMMQLLKTKFDESSVTISKYDKYIYSYVSYKREDGGEPFYIWSYDTNKEAIQKMLEGKEVSMKADVTKNNEHNAVKFNVVGIKFKCRNETVQKELDKLLSHFEAILTHSGNSYYRCGEKYYAISSDPQTVSFSFSKDTKGEPINKNMVYKKIRTNNPVLSPYATWTMKLSNFTGDFGLLRKFQNQQIDIELEGKGQYIARGEFDKEVCDQDLEQYYTKYSQESISYKNMNEFLEESSEWFDTLKPSVASGATSLKHTSLLLSFLGGTITSIMNWCSNSHRLTIRPSESYINKPPFDFNKGLPIKAIGNVHENRIHLLNDHIDVSVIGSHSNLLLWDFFVKWKFGGESDHVDGIASHALYNGYDEEYASQLAYSHYL